VSGDTISIIAAHDSDVVRFVDAISRLPDGLPDWVLIGGVAVVLRVGGMHRATVDIDTLVRESDRLVELLLHDGGEQRAAHKFVVPIATQLDVMAVGSLPDLSSVEPSEYAFASAREWAFTTATGESVEVRNEDGRLSAGASMRVATTAGLIALKSVSLPRRADSNNPAKATSDTIDLLALIETEPIDDIASALAGAPRALHNWIATTCKRVFITDRRYTEARLRVARQSTSTGALLLAGQLAEALGEALGSLDDDA
jgi:hypothetical protein